ncbi:hypothetical protein Ddye_012659 [Dipteronia dyeriana]|uniref:Uncharacterized protein n=1 Tax=Dipteronia dyeriana TaxID=168575 RepID=A0AAD9X4P9_9ROSI|nr:hypothetical protein Ddye_012659 [Dipteronia dyeriana]
MIFQLGFGGFLSSLLLTCVYLEEVEPWKLHDVCALLGFFLGVIRFGLFFLIFCLDDPISVQNCSLIVWFLPSEDGYYANSLKHFFISALFGFEYLSLSS